MSKPICRGELRSRLKHYSKQTGIRFETRDRRQIAGLPDLRGFTPHLRSVQLNSGSKNDFSDWILHDILHIVFYDFATHSLGRESWLDHVRFVENHLASEAFAVLALDYSVLAFGRSETLTIDLKAADWSRFQNENPALPPLRTPELAELLLQHYLTGDYSRLLAPSPSKKYSAWLDHEIRYARKQRAYVEMWYADLSGKPYRSRAAVVQDSEVYEPVWWLLETLLDRDEEPWHSHTKEIARGGAVTANTFEGFKKYRTPLLTPDFRFTDISALGSREAARRLQAAADPSGSALYLAWQILSTGLKLPAREARGQAAAARRAQADAFTKADWKRLRALALRRLETLDFRCEPARRAVFYLP